MKIGIIRERKNPPDSRVPFSPKQCRAMLNQYADRLEILVEGSPNRCYKDEEYVNEGIEVRDELTTSGCELLFGIKEVPIENLIPNIAYFFFSHTIKKQERNRRLLQAIIAKNIQLVDYERLVNPDGKRLLGFGRFAGIVGAYNGLLAYGKKMRAFNLKPAHTFTDFEALVESFGKQQLPPLRILITGNGRVAKGAKETLDLLKIRQVAPKYYLEKRYSEPVYAMLLCKHMYAHKRGGEFDRADFFANPQNYRSVFEPYTRSTDLMINGIYWDPKAPIFFTPEDMSKPEFVIKVIADVTCDIKGSIPATLRATKIENPVFGFDPVSETETEPYLLHTIDMMTVDNLPNELPRDASVDFGDALMQHLIPVLFSEPEGRLIKAASITRNGDLTPAYEYLRDYVGELAK